MDKFIKIMMLVVIALVAAAGIAATLVMQEYNGRQKSFEESLQQQGITVSQGKIDSPSLLLSVNRTSFVQMALETKQVYFDSGSVTPYRYYVFNKEMTIAYWWDYDGT
jgi:flagellar basal body-associated protein FliL